MAKVVGMNPTKFMPRYMEYLAKPESGSLSVQDVIHNIKHGSMGGTDAAVL